MTLVVRLVQVPRATIFESLDALQLPGEDGLEAIVLWFGHLAGDGRARVTRTYVPKQTAYRSKEGLSLRVDAEEMAVIAGLQQRDRLLAQLHSHPTVAFSCANRRARYAW